MKQGRIETQSPLHPPILLRPKGPIFFCETVRSVWDREHSTVNLGWQVVVGDWTYHILDSWHQFNINIRAIIIKYIIICVCGFEYMSLKVKAQTPILSGLKPSFKQSGLCRLTLFNMWVDGQSMSKRVQQYTTC